MFNFYSFAQKRDFPFEKTGSFYPDKELINKENIEWEYLTVLENSNNKTSKKIKLAIAILKKTSNNKNINPVVMIDGGLGARSIEGVSYWLNHPLRENSNIILMDARENRVF